MGTHDMDQAKVRIGGRDYTQTGLLRMGLVAAVGIAAGIVAALTWSIIGLVSVAAALYLIDKGRGERPTP